MGGRRRPRATARAEVLPFPARDRRRRASGRTIPRLPSPRSILVGLVLAAGAVGIYVAARETSMFAVRAIDVRGASPRVAEDVRRALRPLVGTSLVSFERVDADRRLVGLSQVAAASYDRDFPHTLRVFVRTERPVAVLRQGIRAWLVSARARVVRELTARPYPRLPRIWIGRSVDVSAGDTLTEGAADAARAAALVERARLPVSVRGVRAGDEELTVILGSGREIRLGSTADARLKLAIAGRLLSLAKDASYVDVSVPARPVAGGNSQLEGRG